MNRLLVQDASGLVLLFDLATKDEVFSVSVDSTAFSLGSGVVCLDIVGVYCGLYLGWLESNDSADDPSLCSLSVLLVCFPEYSFVILPI